MTQARKHHEVTLQTRSLTPTADGRSTATSLTLAADPKATNSIDGPRTVAPVTSKVPGVKPGFTYTVPKHGIVVLILETG